MKASGPKSRTFAALGIAVALLSACTPADDDFYSFTPDPERMHSPVSDANAPTISELEAQGFKRTFWDADHYACAADCDAIHYYAFYLGQATPDELCAQWRDERQGGLAACREMLMDASQYVCPATRDQMDDDNWTCRPLD